MRKSVSRALAGVLVLGGALWADGAAYAGNGSVASAEPPLHTLVEAEAYAAQWGTRAVVDERASGGRIVTGFSPGDLLHYTDVSVRTATTTLLCFATSAVPPDGTEVGTVDVRIGSLRSQPVQSIPLRNWLGVGATQWAVGGPLPDGVHRVFLTLRQPRNSPPVSLDYVVFTGYPPPPSLNC